MHAAVLVPVKAFAAAKGRLAGTLLPDQRRQLARWMAERVLAAAGELPVFVACDDDEVADWAVARGARVMWRPGSGLNGAVTDSVVELAGSGFDVAVVAHSDLPGADDLAALATPARVTIVPDHRRDGTNVIALPTATPFEFAYGGGSFGRHLQAALATGLPVCVRHDHLLSLDVDGPADLRHPLLHDRLPTWLPTSPANHR